MANDRQLLREYANQGSRQALEELIQRYLGLVYSSALRQVRDPNLAEDVTQAAFLVFTQKARTIRSGEALGGWLLTVTRYAVVNLMRNQALNKKHEQQAAKPEAILAAANEWEEIAPLLDAQLNRLTRRDRDAVVLRFFQDRSFAEIGVELGLSEDTARKRVTRALERLRTGLAGKKRSLTTGALGMAIGMYAVGAVPRHVLAGTVAASVGSATPHCVSLAKGAIKMIAWAKAKLVGTVAATVLMGGTSAVVVTHAIAEEQAAPAALAAPATAPAAPVPAAPPAPAGPNGVIGAHSP